MTAILLAWFGTIFDIVFLIPQLIKILKNKSINDISLITNIFTLTAGILWIFYGIGLKEFFLLISNIFVVLFSLILIILQIWWSKYDKTLKKINKTKKELMKLSISEIDNLINELKVKEKE